MTSPDRWTAVGVAVLLACAGCSEDQALPNGPDVAGWYEVTHHTLSDGDCMTEGGDATGLPYIRLTEEVHDTTAYLALRRCQSMDATDCDSEDFFGGTSFVIPIENGWQERKAGAAFQPVSGDCYLSYGEATLVQNGDGVIVELRRYEEVEPGIGAADCTHERAMDRADLMPCLDFEVIHGQPPVD